MAQCDGAMLLLVCRYRLIGLIKTLCGVLVPAIVTTLSTFAPESRERSILMIVSIMVSVLGTLSTALEDFYQYATTFLTASCV